MEQFLQVLTIILCFIFSIKWASSSCRHSDLTVFKRNTVTDGVNFKILLQSSPGLCMKECLSFSACGAVNMYPAYLRCELVLQSSSEIPNKIMASTSGDTVNADDIPKEYAGTCRDHTCPVTDVCVSLTSGQHVCMKYEFCSGLPTTISKTTYTVDNSRGVPSALYSCILGAGYVGGDKNSMCDPLTKTWSLATIVCSTDLPEACGDPPPLENTSTFTRPYNGDAYKAMYTCGNRSGEASSDHCPLTKCTGIEQWTSGASISCSNKDCYANPVYDGQVTCTDSGLTCQRWDQQTPHSHGYFTSSDLNNYCRISSDNTRPWCYTMDSGVRWEYCPVSSC